MDSFSKLQEYIADNSKKNGNSVDGNLNSKSTNRTWWFTSSSEDSEKVENDTDNEENSWFTSAQSDPLLPAMTKKQRIIGFVGCLAMGLFCFVVSGLYIPLLIFKARKFSLLYSLGSLFFIGSFSMLWGPWNHIKHLFSGNRLPFTAAYFGTMFATLYFAMWAKSTILTVTFAILQIVALVWYIVSYIPGGQTGLKFFSKIFYLAASKTVQKTLPV